MNTEKNSNFMSRKLITIDLGDSMRKAYQLMKEKKIRHLPVTEPGGDIVGVISDRDVQRAMKPAKTVAGFVEEQIEFLDDFFARDFMSWPVYSVNENDSISSTVGIILKEKISALLVRDRNNRIKGIITTDDMMRLLQDLLLNEPEAKKKSVSDTFPAYSFGDMHWESKSECM